MKRNIKLTGFALILLLSGLAVLGQDLRLAENGMVIDYDLLEGKYLRELLIYPEGFEIEKDLSSDSQDDNLEVIVHCTGENYVGVKLNDCQPALRLEFTGKEEEKIPGGRRIFLNHYDPVLKLRVRSVYDFFEGTSTCRRHTRLTNESKKPIGIESVSSAMINNFGNLGQGSLDDKLVIHWASNNWDAEGQWNQNSPEELGWTDNGKYQRSGIFKTTLGSWSTVIELPFAMVENTAAGLTWFWQIEHNGSWHWEMSHYRGYNDPRTYVYAGGPDERHHHAWKELEPGETYVTVPVAVGVVRGGFEEAVEEATRYRRIACLKPHPDNQSCAVIFNDYMNCLGGRPTTEKELPLIAAAAAAGCDYFVIDAGWYAEIDEKWGETVGMWQPSKTRWPNGMKEVLDSIWKNGMIPGLWLEIEFTGINSPLKDKPDSWFFMRHGRRIQSASRYFLDFRNPGVVSHSDEVVDRVVEEYGAGYIKMDYNRTALMGTETDASSMGQGLLEHQKAYLDWVDNVYDRHPGLIIENCGSGGGRMDYALLSRHQIQSSSDQTDYRRYPAILVGAIAAVLPEQLAVWTYPLRNGNKYEASFNMVNSMLCRVHQSGHLAELPRESFEQVKKGIEVYKRELAPVISQCIPFFPLGMPSLEDELLPVALGMKHIKADYYAVWRLSGKSTVQVPLKNDGRAEILYPTDLGIELESGSGVVSLSFPEPNMGVIIKVNK
jgi:alpha-galactosidase